MDEIRKKKLELALSQVLDTKIKPYSVYLLLPYDEDGGEKLVKVSHIYARTSAEACNMVAQMYELPTIDEEIYPLDKDKREINKYGIIKVQRQIEDIKISKMDLVEAVKYALSNHHTEIIENQEFNNNEEVIEKVMRKFDIRKNDLF